MATRESKQKKEEISQIFHEVAQIALMGAGSDTMKEVVKKHQARFEELMAPVKRGTRDGEN